MYIGNMNDFISELNKFLKEAGYGCIGGTYTNSVGQLYIAYFRKGYNTSSDTKIIYDTEDLEDQILKFIKNMIQRHGD